MKNKILLFLLIGIFLISFTSAFNWNDGTIKGYYNLDETSGATVINQVGTNGSQNLMIQNQNGIIGKSYKADGTANQYINTTIQSKLLNSSTGEFSISFWVNTTSTSAGILLGNEINGIDENGDYQFFYNSGKWSVSIRNGSGTNTQRIMTSNLTQLTNIFTHFVLTKDSSNNFKLYQNGTLVNITSMNNWIANTNSLYLASRVGNTLTNTQIDEVGVWNRTLTELEVSELYNSGNGLGYSVSTISNITINLISPTNNNLLSTVGTNFTTNLNISGTNYSYQWNNITYYIWKNNSLFNQTTITGLIGNNTQNTQFIDSFTLGDYVWNAKGCYSNATYSNCTYATNGNFTYSVGATINSQSFNNNTYETARETFSVNVNLLAGSELALAKLIYNGINYTVSDVTLNSSNSSITATLTKSIDIPTINSTYQLNTFYWIFTYNGGQVQTLTSQTQNVSYINLQLCNATYTQKALNFTMVDELTGLNLNATANPVTYQTSFNYWIGSGSVQKNYSYQLINSSSTNSFQFCLFPTNATLKIDMLTQYGAYNYADRLFSLMNYTINNQTQNFLLYNLLSASATKFNIIVKQGTDFASDVIVDVYKYFVGEGLYKRVMVGVTDDNGQFVGNLQIDQQYQFFPTLNGVNYTPIIKQSSCTSTPCEINLNIGDIAVSSFADYYTYFAQNVDYNLTYNDSLKTVNLSFVDKTGTANYWRLLVYLPNSTSDNYTTICDVKSYSSIGNLDCDYSNYTGDIVAKVYISRSPEKLVDFILFANENISTILGTSAILASIIIILVVFFTGIRNPVGALVLLPFALIILKIIGFLPLDWSWILGIVIFDIWIITRLRI